MASVYLSFSYSSLTTNLKYTVGTSSCIKYFYEVVLGVFKLFPIPNLKITVYKVWTDMGWTDNGVVSI